MYARPGSARITGARNVEKTRTTRRERATGGVAAQFYRHRGNQHSIRVFVLRCDDDHRRTAPARRSILASSSRHDDSDHDPFCGKGFFTTNRSRDAADTSHSLEIERISANRFAARCPLRASPTHVGGRQSDVANVGSHVRDAADRSSEARAPHPRSDPELLLQEFVHRLRVRFAA